MLIEDFFEFDEMLDDYASADQKQTLEYLLESSAIPMHYIEYIFKRIDLISRDGAELLEEYLLNNQRDNITGGYNYRAGDIQWKLKYMRDSED